MNIKNYLTKYSFNFFAVIFWILLSILLVIVFFAVIVSNINVQLVQVIIWYTLFFFPTILLPAALTLCICVYKFLLEKEKLKSDFKIKNNFITESPFYLIFIIISLLLTFSSILLLTCISTYIMFLNIELFKIFIFVGIPISIIIIIIYLFLRKHFLHNIGAFFSPCNQHHQIILVSFCLLKVKSILCFSIQFLYFFLRYV